MPTDWSSQENKRMAIDEYDEWRMLCHWCGRRTNQTEWIEDADNNLRCPVCGCVTPPFDDEDSNDLHEEPDATR